MFWKMLGVNLDHPVVDFTSKQPKISGKSCRERDWHRAVRRSERPPRSTKAEVINWWSADNFAFGLNNSCIVGTNIFVWMPSLCFTYSHLSNKREVTLTDFETLHPPQKINPPSTFIDFLDFPPSTPRLLDLCTSFFQKFHPPRLFQAPRLAIWQLLHPLHVYSKLHVYKWDESN